MAADPTGVSVWRPLRLSQAAMDEVARQQQQRRGPDARSKKVDLTAKARRAIEQALRRKSFADRIAKKDAGSRPGIVAGLSSGTAALVSGGLLAAVAIALIGRYTPDYATDSDPPTRAIPACSTRGLSRRSNCGSGRAR